MDFVTNNIMYVLLAVVSGGMLLWQTLKGTGGSQLTPQAATLLMNREDALVLDVRDAAEWASGHIPNARHISLDQLDKHLPEINKYKTRPLIVSCQSGHRSSGACGKLKKQGFEQVYNLAGGIAAWRDAGLPVTTK
ncbi:Rhodanese-related sulfurtransferase [Sterolibacterium denitrificans]|uniref:Rhodanese-related sulfurtransferase n=1 Tax=Sterolibacterium denitrificans TaxID=157592 RepID=A0A7Z7HQ11_9PROT|nr:rhodanese-like domain-containing protein [Sterolibacterium denitrificans]SMB24034.1 Rhodanese-related sulfurtransferase [Sterolibacterium denitrificans]